MGFSLVSSQSLPNAASYWFAGVNTNVGQKHNLMLYTGFSSDDHFTALAVIPYFRLTKNIHVSPTYMRFEANGAFGSEPTQHHFMPSVSLQFKLGKKFILADRNMFFQISMKDRDDVTFYRNRIGLTYLTKVGKKPSAFYVNNAMFWSLDGGSFFRNRLMLGGLVHWKKWLTPQFMYVLQNDVGLFPRHQFYFVFTVPLGNFGIFNKKHKEPEHPTHHKPLSQDF